MLAVARHHHVEQAAAGDARGLEGGGFLLQQRLAGLGAVSGEDGMRDIRDVYRCSHGLAPHQPRDAHHLSLGEIPT